MGEILKEVGLTEKEATVYIFLSQRGIQRSGEIAKGVKTHRAEVYRILKNLQDKGFVEATLESPTRFIPVPFATIIDSFVESKQQEADKIEKARQELLENWNALTKPRMELMPEKFAVLEGRQKIYRKFLEMVNKTKSQLSAITTAQALVRINQFGIVDAALTHPLKSRVAFKFITELTKENLATARHILNQADSAGINLQGRTSELGLKPYPQMVIRDEEEAVFFTKSQADLPLAEQDKTCLWTDSKSLVQAFQQLFNESWRNSSDLKAQVNQLDGKVMPLETPSLTNESVKKYRQLISQAQKEILMMISSDGVIDLAKDAEQVKEWKKRGLSVKILAPLTTENSEAAKALSDCCEIKHAPTGYLDSTIIDGNHLFQFNNSSIDSKKIRNPLIQEPFYSTDTEHIGKARGLFEELWMNAHAPSENSVISLTRPPASEPSSSLDGAMSKIIRNIRAHVGVEEATKITEKEVLDRLVSAQINLPDSSVDITRTYGFNGQAVIRTPTSFGLPEMLFHMYYFEKDSTFGEGDAILLAIKQQTPSGHFFLPSAIVYDNDAMTRYWKKIVAGGYPFEENVAKVQENELKIKLHGNTLFCGWTMEIPLFPPPLRLMPSCILLEGYGKLKTESFAIKLLSGYKVFHEQNGFDAFVTYINPKSSYSGPGTDGWIGRDHISTTYPPSTH